MRQHAPDVDDWGNTFTLDEQGRIRSGWISGACRANLPRLPGRMSWCRGGPI
ncbi:hypothetical protein [Deinococcus fonticola]|uniref:hypothetical protein n=1 Tax=Deinococcus fonticola TaxID=2528713 RepID=UPI001431F5C1|nr:hypothetical protein [Deinococcus fonticola]